MSRCWPPGPAYCASLTCPQLHSRFLSSVGPSCCRAAGLSRHPSVGPQLLLGGRGLSRSVARHLTSRWSSQSVIHQHSVISYLEDIWHRCTLISASICLVRHPASRRRSQSQPPWHPPCCWPGTATGSHTECSRSPPRTFTPQTFRNGGGGPPMRVCRDNWIELN